MFNSDTLSLSKSNSKKVQSKPLRDLCINVSDSPVKKPPNINSPVAIVNSKKKFIAPRYPSTAPVTPMQSLQTANKTLKDSQSKIKSPSNYIFATHSHSTKFALTPKKASSQKTFSQLTTRENTSKNIESIINKSKPPKHPKSKTRDQQKQHLHSTFQAIKIAKSLREPSIEELISKHIRLFRNKNHDKRKTVIFDLDETLVHCVNNNEISQYELEIEFPAGTFNKIGLNIRPYARELLAAASKEFEVIIFTASHKCYADKVIDFLDPEKQWVHHRFYRENCIQIDGTYVKDLRIFVDRFLKDLIIVDNAAYSFAFQIANGIPIISWYNNFEDRELYKLIEYLRVLARVNDIRLVNQLTFHLDTFYDDYLRDFISKSNKENAVS
ncbi:hypothetical protein SteCoe_27573 [Stentor coeruleus]|uniref:FCP1 homology domain-containing protein n=1 Tax=Stentor coeruleus TaxID=5963 RepID=A0A1R2BAB9_9CILI|nr:hypothetical protein SteCoe_27573 [Stentor coeruleus]